MSWPKKLGGFEDGLGIVQALRNDGHRIGDAYIAATVASKAQPDDVLTGARQYLESYKQPRGAERSPDQLIENRNHIVPLPEEQFIEHFSKIGSVYDYDRLIDPCQHIDLQGTTIRDVALGIVGGIDNPTQKVCAIYDYVKQNVSYEYNTQQYGCGNYWASAAETLIHCQGDCACQAVLFGALCQGAGFATRHVCIPGHAFCQVLMPSCDATPVQQWYIDGGRKSSLSTGVNYWIAPLADNSARYWLNCDLTMCHYAGARASTVPAGTSGTGLSSDASSRTWCFPHDWLAKKGGKSVTYRYPSNMGTRFEWAVGSQVDGGAPDAPNDRCVGMIAAEGQDEDADEVKIYCAAFDAWTRYDIDDNGAIDRDEMQKLLDELGCEADVGNFFGDQAVVSFPELYASFKDPGYLERYSAVSGSMMQNLSRYLPRTLEFTYASGTKLPPFQVHPDGSGGTVEVKGVIVEWIWADKNFDTICIPYTEYPGTYKNDYDYHLQWQTKQGVYEISGNDVGSGGSFTFKVGRDLPSEIIFEYSSGSKLSFVPSADRLVGTVDVRSVNVIWRWFENGAGIHIPYTRFPGTYGSDYDYHLNWDERTGIYEKTGEEIGSGGSFTFSWEESVSEKIATAFKLYDLNGDGFITRDELSSLMRKIDNPDMWDDDAIDTLLSGFDHNGDGQISYTEFVESVMANEADFGVVTYVLDRS